MRYEKRLLFERALSLLVCVAFLFFMELIAVNNPDLAVVKMEEQEGIALPVIMYHSILKDPQRWGKYVISPAQFEEDLEYLKMHGYETVLPKDLLAYVEGEGVLPPKPVMITFDDGFYNNLLYAMPLLKKYGMKAVVSPIGYKADEFFSLSDQNPAYAYMNWDDIKTLIAEGAVEIGNHSWRMHNTDKGRNGVTREAGESRDAYEKALVEDVMTLQEALYSKCGYTPSTFAYPLGKYSEESQSILKRLGFRVFLTCYEKVNYIQKEESSLYSLGRFNRPSGISTEKFMQKVLGEPK